MPKSQHGEIEISPRDVPLAIPSCLSPWWGLLSHFSCLISRVSCWATLPGQVAGFLKEQLGVTRLAVHGESIGGIAAANAARHCQVQGRGNGLGLHVLPS